MINKLVDSGKKFPSGGDIQTTSFSLDAMSRFVCNTFDEVIAAESEGGWQFDIIIIGSGMYGGYAASKLYNFNKNKESGDRPRILVLEAGPFFVSEHFQNLTRFGSLFNLVKRQIVEDNQTYFTQINNGALEGMTPHHQCVGGKSLFWGGWSPRLTADDFSRKDADGDDLWPTEVVTFLNSPDGYQFVEEQIGVSATTDFITGQFNSSLKEKIQLVLGQGALSELYGVIDAPIAVQGQSPESGLFSMDKFSSLPLLLSSIREDCENDQDKDRHLFLVPNAEVLKLEVNEGVVERIVLVSTRISSDVNFPDPIKQVRRLSVNGGASVILAGNTINSTRLALNSFPAHTPGSALMGKNLMAHVRGNYVWRIHRSALNLPSNNDPSASFSTSALHVAGRANLSSSGRKTGNYHLQFYGVGSTGVDPEEYLYRFVPHLDDIRVIRDAVLSTNIKDWIVVGIRSCGEMFGNKSVDTAKRDKSFISVNPFGGAGDDVYIENGQELRIPKTFLCLVQTPADEEVRNKQTNSAFDLIAALTGLSVSDVSSTNTNNKVHLLSKAEDAMGSTYHESGTLCMGTDPNKSVTDVNGHFHYVANVYCIDQSVLPTVGSANPVPTVLSLTQKVVRHINARYEDLPLLPIDAGFESLFDGTLENWKFFGAGEVKALPGLSILEAGTNGVRDVLGFLRYEKQKFRNFILRVDYKSFSIHANSGIFLHMPDLGEMSFEELYNKSIEVQIDETGKTVEPIPIKRTIYGSSLHKTGAIYNLAQATHVSSKAISPRNSNGYWNSFLIEVNQESIKVALNGEVVSKATLSEAFRNDGYLAIQCHSDVVQFRNIQIKSL